MNHLDLHVAGTIGCAVAVALGLTLVEWGWVELALIYPGSGLLWMAALTVWSRSA